LSLTGAAVGALDTCDKSVITRGLPPSNAVGAGGGAASELAKALCSGMFSAAELVAPEFAFRIPSKPHPDRTINTVNTDAATLWPILTVSR
jgi:hypothetical protein